MAMSQEPVNKRRTSTDSTKSTRSAEEQFNSMSVLRYFTSELTRGYLLEREEEKYAQKRERVYTFMNTPRELEKFCTYGFFQCVDAFLFIFTFLPLRIVLAVFRMFTLPCGLMRSRKLLEPAQVCDLLKGVILVMSFFITSYIDTSMMYHLVRGQATIKLYVFFNMLDMADRLMSNFGHDILDALFWTATEPRDRKREHLGTLPHLVIAIIYVILHTLLILFQATVLNVAFNSHNKSLLVIMMSNNFVEIKGSLFRKVDVNHLYQIACSDVKERFHYVLLLSIVCIRNMTEVAWDPEHLRVLLPDAFLVLVSEVFVDWGKHAFILKFNEVQASIYREYTVKLALDMASSRQGQAFTDPSDLVSRRMGLTPLPLACLLFGIINKSVRLTSWMSYLIVFVLYLCLVSFKVLNSIILLGHSYRKIQEYHDEKGTDSTNQEEDETPTANENTAPDTSNQSKPVVKHERSSSEGGNVPRNFSQIFGGDSFNEVTNIPETHVIERSPRIKLISSKPHSSDSDISVFEMEHKSCDGSSKCLDQSESLDMAGDSSNAVFSDQSASLLVGDSSTAIFSDQSASLLAGDSSNAIFSDQSASLLAGDSSNAIFSDQSASLLAGDSSNAIFSDQSASPHLIGDTSIAGNSSTTRASEDLHSNLVHRSHKARSLGIKHKFGSSVSLPETIGGIPECLENGLGTEGPEDSSHKSLKGE